MRYLRMNWELILRPTALLYPYANTTSWMLVNANEVSCELLPENIIVLSPTLPDGKTFLQPVRPDGT